MDLRIDPATIELQPRQPIRLRVGAGQHITGVRGTAWITVDNDPRDVVLEPGDTHAFDRAGRVVVQSLGGGALLAAEVGIEIAHDAPGNASGFWRNLRRAAAAPSR